MQLWTLPRSISSSNPLIRLCFKFFEVSFVMLKVIPSKKPVCVPPNSTYCFTQTLEKDELQFAFKKIILGNFCTVKGHLIGL